LLTRASVDDVGVALVSLCAVTEIPRAIGGVDALTVIAHASVMGLVLGGSTRHGRRAAAVANGPVEPQRHPLAPWHGRQVRRPERVVPLLYDEAIVAGTEILVVVRPGIRVPELHQVVGEPRRDVDVAAADAGALAVLRALGVVAEGHATGVEGVGEAAGRPVVGVRQGVAAEDVRRAHCGCRRCGTRRPG